ncbi:threonine synthase [Salibacterium halotolerans]|uniref:Threonine synthase n=1 Tax=Salibacterium halotolerans TaxID=1884432 RepID=A0A1I5PQH4_9BACI|nr:threonine synthase [Salibacterium halotolerans]
MPVDSGQASVYIKLESQNPTGFHKDRMSAYLVSMAKSQNYKGIVIASSGNAGLSIASYAAFACIPCVLIATKQLNPDAAGIIELHDAVENLIRLKERLQVIRLQSNLFYKNIYTPE